VALRQAPVPQRPHQAQPLDRVDRRDRRVLVESALAIGWSPVGSMFRRAHIAWLPDKAVSKVHIGLASGV
jgi:hypothetical protein